MMNLLSYVGRFSSFLFLPFQSLNPILSVVLVAFLTTLIITVYKKILFERGGFMKIKREMDEIREKILKSGEESSKYVQRLMELNKILFKQFSKILIFSLLIGILSLSWVQYNYSGKFVKVPLPLFQNLGIIYFYIILTFIISVVLSKLLEVSI